MVAPAFCTLFLLRVIVNCSTVSLDSIPLYILDGHDWTVVVPDRGTLSYKSISP